MEFDIGKLRDPVDGQEHMGFALGRSEFADINVHIANLRLGEALALGCILGILGEP